MFATEFSDRMSTAGLTEDETIPHRGRRAPYNRSGRERGREERSVARQTIGDDGTGAMR
jgi:hypothetical protein